VIGQRADIQQVGASDVVAVERVTAQTKPSGVVFDVLVPVQAWEDLGANTWVEPLATQIEYYFSSGQVSGARYEEDLDSAGLVTFYIVFDVTIPPVPGAPPLENTAEVKVPLEALRERILVNSIVQPALDKARNALAFTADL
jgi:hypothetical protein